MAATTAAELAPVVHVAGRLRSLLEHAQSVKPETSVEPALPIADFIDDVDALHNDIPDHYDQPYRVKVVEAAVREIFYALITSTEIQDTSFVQVWNLLDIVLICGDHGKCDAGLVCLLLEELLDSQTTDGCRTVFDYLDSRRDRLAQKDFDKKNLIFLRSCNELLRRLSRAEDAIFCGRVFFFLFRTFPLGDKSSVNLRGEFHIENTTKFVVSGPTTGDTDMEVDTKDTTPTVETPKPIAPQKPGSRAVPIKAPPKKVPEEEVLSASDLYPIFWSLQHDFTDPTRLFDEENFATLKKGLAATITKFKKTPTVVQTKAGEEGKRGTKRKMGEHGTTSGDDHLVDNYNPKYLTSGDLFELELSDLAFQRHILVQGLILIDFLLSLTEKTKKRLAALATPNKSMLHAFTLSEDDVKWATSTRSAITSYLSLTQEGRGYCRMVETVLARDKNWVRWKVESCPSIVKGPVSTEQEMAARKGARDATRPRKFGNRADNSMDLSFLDEGSGGLEALKDSSRYTAPSIEQLVERVKTDKLDLEMAADEEETRSLEVAIQNAKWRALRQARSWNLSLLDQIESTKALDEMLLAPGNLASETEPEVEGNGEDAGNDMTTTTVEEPTAIEEDPPSVPVESTDMQE